MLHTAMREEKCSICDKNRLVGPQLLKLFHNEKSPQNDFCCCTNVVLLFLLLPHFVLIRTNVIIAPLLKWFLRMLHTSMCMCLFPFFCAVIFLVKLHSDHIKSFVTIQLCLLCMFGLSNTLFPALLMASASTGKHMKLVNILLMPCCFFSCHPI